MIQIEEPIAEAHRRGDFDGAATAGLELYRGEIYSFLCVRVGGESDAHEVFAQLTEDLWRGLPTFRWRCSFRTWLYTLARHAAIRHERLVANQPARRRGLSTLSGEPQAYQRTRTPPHRRTDVKQRFAELRKTLSKSEQTLLVLRVDRGLAWDAIARIMQDDLAADFGDEDESTIKQRSANLRQRFRSIKARLSAQAQALGLLSDDS